MGGMPHEAAQGCTQFRSDTVVGRLRSTAPHFPNSPIPIFSPMESPPFSASYRQRNRPLFVSAFLYYLQVALCWGVARKEDLFHP
jgi:hypothetical protein